VAAAGREPVCGDPGGGGGDLGADSGEARSRPVTRLFQRVFGRELHAFGSPMPSARDRPNRIAGFRTWLKLGRSVRKGETALRILAPMSVKQRDQLTGEENDERRVFFKTTFVFDPTQTLVCPATWCQAVSLAPVAGPVGRGCVGEAGAADVAVGPADADFGGCPAAPVATAVAGGPWAPSRTSDARFSHGQQLQGHPFWALGDDAVDLGGGKVDASLAQQRSQVGAVVHAGAGHDLGESPGVVHIAFHRLPPGAFRAFAIVVSRAARRVLVR